MAIAGRSYTNTPVISRGSLEDPTDFGSPTKQVVVSVQYDRRWSATKPVTIVVNPQPVIVIPVATPDPVVVVPVDVRAWYRTNVTNLQRNTLQDVPSATQPVVSSTPAAQIWFKTKPAQVLSNPQALVIPATATPAPIVVSVPSITAWFKTSAPRISSNPQAPAVIPGTATPAPVVVSSTRGAQFLFRQAQVVRNPLPPSGPQPDIRTALHLGGTVGIPNPLGGTVTVVNLLGGSATVLSPIAGTLNLKAVDGTAQVQPVLGGAAVVISPYSSSLVEWTMQEVDIVLAEFNDETVNLAITSNGSALNITGYTLEMYLKPLRGSADTASGVVKLSTSTGEITVTNAPGGLATVAIPATDFTSVNDIYTFYRVDTIDTNSKRNTAIFGLVTITQL